MSDLDFSCCGLVNGACSRQIPYDIEKHDKMIYQQGRADMKAEYESADIPLIHGKEELAEHDKQIRADVIDEIIKHFEEHHIVIFDKFEIVDELEQLKEQTND